MKLKCRLRVILAELEITQQELLQRMEKPIANASMSQIVRGSSMPTLLTAFMIAKALNMKIEEIWIESST